MDAFLLFAVTGLAVGAVYALSGVGLVVLYRASGVINFAYGALGALSAFVAWTLMDLEYAPWLAYSAGVGVATLLSFLYGRYIAPHLSHQERIVRAIATLGFALMIMGFAEWYWGETVRSLSLPTDSDGVYLGGLRITYTRILAFSLAVVMTLLIAQFLLRTRLGLSMRALASNRVLSGVLGIRTVRVDAWAWLISGLFAGITGLLLANMVRLNATVLAFLVIPALSAAIVGRLTYLSTTLLGGLLIGVLESLGTLIPAFAPFRSTMPFIVAIAAMLWMQRKGVSLSRQEQEAT